MEYKLIHLPAENTNSPKSGIYIDSDNKLHPHNITNGGRMCHLYITYVGTVGYKEYFISEENIIKRNINLHMTIESTKIFASTDKSLPSLLIKKNLVLIYVKFNGKQNTIDQYLLEEYTYPNRSNKPLLYSKEKVEKLCKKAYKDASPMMKEDKEIEIDWNKWKSKNI